MRAAVLDHFDWLGDFRQRQSGRFRATIHVVRPRHGANFGLDVLAQLVSTHHLTVATPTKHPMSDFENRSHPERYA